MDSFSKWRRSRNIYVMDKRTIVLRGGDKGKIEGTWASRRLVPSVEDTLPEEIYLSLPYTKDKPKHNSIKVQLGEPMSLLDLQSMDGVLLTAVWVTKQPHHQNTSCQHG